MHRLNSRTNTEAFISNANDFRVIDRGRSTLRDGGATLISSNRTSHRFQYRSDFVGIIGPIDNDMLIGMSVVSPRSFMNGWIPEPPVELQPIDVAPPEQPMYAPVLDDSTEETISLPRGWFSATHRLGQEWYCILVGDRRSALELYNHLIDVGFAARDTMTIHDRWVRFRTIHGETFQVFYEDHCVVSFRAPERPVTEIMFHAVEFIAEDFVVTRNVEEVPAVAPFDHLAAVVADINWEQIAREARDEVVYQRRQLNEFEQELVFHRMLADERLTQITRMTTDHQDAEARIRELHSALTEERRRNRVDPPLSTNSAIYRDGELLRCPAGAFRLMDICGVIISAMQVYVLINGVSRSVLDLDYGQEQTQEQASENYRLTLQAWESWLNPQPEPTIENSTYDNRAFVQGVREMLHPYENIFGEAIRGHRADAVVMDDPVRQPLARQPRFADQTMATTASAPIQYSSYTLNTTDEHGNSRVVSGGPGEITTTQRREDRF